MKHLKQWAWNSPTLTTWASLATRTLSLVVVLPLVLRRFQPAEVALWQVFATLIGLQLLADLGFSQTFSRLIAYAMAGATDLRNVARLGIDVTNTAPAGSRTANWQLLERITATMRLLYHRIGLWFGLLLLVGGSLALNRRIEALHETVAGPATITLTTTTAQAWLAWAFIVFTSIVNLRGNAYSNFLQGTNHVALVRRWEALFGFGAIFTSILVLTLHSGLLALVLANQSWILLSVWRNGRLARRVLEKRFADFPRPKQHAEVFTIAWSSAWRSAIGTFMGFGVVQLSGLFFAQSRDSVAVASYLLATRLVQTISTISQAPFYSKLPVFALLWAEGELGLQVKLAQRSMILSYWTFVGPFILVGLLAPVGLVLINSKTPFPSNAVWGLLGVATLLERYGAMHLQLYSSTNNIVWHIANGVSGIIFMVVALFTYPYLKVAALPLGMLAANLGFYSWYSSRLSHRAFSLTWPHFDLKTIGAPALCLGSYIVYLCTLSQRAG